MVEPKKDQKKKYYSWKEIGEKIENATNYISKKYGEKIDSVYGIPNNSLILALAISKKLNKKLILNEKEIKSNTLIVDEIYDSGGTVSNFKKKFPNNKYFVIFIRNNKKNECDHLEVVKNDDWLVFPWEE